MKTTKKKTSAQLKKILWKLFSEYIRRKGSVGDDNWCFTCGVKKPWKMLHAGHYIRASAGLSTYFLERNVHPQCYACNIWRDGNSDEYALMLQAKYGKDILEILNQEKRKIVKDFPFVAKIAEYKDKIADL